MREINSWDSKIVNKIEALQEWEKGNWNVATNLNFLIPISCQSDCVNFRYFKLRIFDLIKFIIKNIKSLPHPVVKMLGLKNLSFVTTIFHLLSDKITKIKTFKDLLYSDIIVMVYFKLVYSNKVIQISIN